MNPRTNQSALGPLAVAIATLIACGDQVTIVECPLGTMPEGPTCVPWEADGADTGADASVEVTPDVPSDDDTPTFPMADIADPDLPVAEETVESPDAVVVPDGPEMPDAEPDVVTGGGLATSCDKHADCADGTCMDWPDGYCTALDCDELEPCPEGGLCLTLSAGNRVCLLGCVDEGACPGENQACKTLAVSEGESFAEVCYGVEEDAAGPGEPCGDTTECQGAASCLSSMPGGYCAVQGCDEAGCADGTVCIAYGGIPTCLRECAVDEDCGGTPGAERRCGLLKSLAGTFAGACISGASGAEIGEQCLNDFECASGTCLVLGEGQCSQTGSPCFDASSDVDCEPTEFCLITGENGVGSCTQPCSLAAVCPGASLCEGQPGAAEGWCRAPCGGVGQNEACRPETGFQCTFGFPIGETSGQGRYLCMRPRPGATGDPCLEDATCETNVCEIAPAPEGEEVDPEAPPVGLCTAPCGDNLYCPFPTICVAGGPQGTCKPACLSVADCAEGMTCAPQPSGLSGTCQ